MKMLGMVLVALGLAGGVYALNMDTSVEAGGQTLVSGSYSIHVPETRVNNIGLMDERRNFLYASGLAVVVGIILFGFGSLQKSPAGSVTDSAVTLKFVALWGLVGTPLLWGVVKTMQNALRLFK
jgi:hypothetical protein